MKFGKIPTNEQFKERATRERWYRRLSEAHGEELEELLRITNHLFDDKALRYQVSDELYETFGTVILKNLYKVNRTIVVPSRDLPDMPPVLPMEALVDVVTKKKTSEEKNLLIQKKIEELYENE